MFGTVITISTLAYLTLGLRVYTRITRRSWGLEDWCMIVAAFPLFVLSIACMVASFNGVGIHQWRLELAENVHYQVDGLFVGLVAIENLLPLTIYSGFSSSKSSTAPQSSQSNSVFPSCYFGSRKTGRGLSMRNMSSWACSQP